MLCAAVTLCWTWSAPQLSLVRNLTPGEVKRGSG